LQVGSGQQVGQGEQGPGLAGAFLSVDFLEADDVRAQPHDLRLHQRNPLRQGGTLIRRGLVEVLEIERRDPDCRHYPPLSSMPSARLSPGSRRIGG
jgi:hypothetical protein